MSTRLEHSARRTDARPSNSPRSLGPAEAPAQKSDEDPAGALSPPSDSETTRMDGDRATTLLLLFLGATTVMVGDVIVAAAVAEWWILVPAFGVLVVTTVVVLAGIMRLIAER
jgi:hypothetical protein